MGRFLMPSLIEVLKSAADTLFRSIADLKFTTLSKVGFNPSAALSPGLIREPLIAVFN